MTTDRAAVTTPDASPNRYASTRQAWEDIWAASSVTAELESAVYPRALETLRTYTAYLDPDDLILEAGSGLGAVIVQLQRMGFPRVIGLDYAAAALATCRQHFPDLPLTVGDVHALPFAENSVGAYLSFGVFEHFESGMAAPLAEAFRVLKPGGVLVLTIPYPNVIHRLVAWRRQRAGESVLTDDDFYESTYTRDQLVEQVTAAGFTIAHTEPTSHAYTLWGLGGIFRAKGYYRTSAAAELIGGALAALLPWAFNFTTLVIARKPPA